MMYMFEKVIYDTGDMVLHSGDLTNSMLIVGSGCLSMTANIENVQDFEVLRMYKGSIINSRNVFIDSEL
jgi:hypothetical protein